MDRRNAAQKSTQLNVSLKFETERGRGRGWSRRTPVPTGNEHGRRCFASKSSFTDGVSQSSDLTSVFSDVLGMVNIYVFSQVWEIAPWMGVHGVLQCHISCACISVSSSSLCQNAAFTRCRSGNGYRLRTDPCIIC